MGRKKSKDPDNFAVHRPRYESSGQDEPQGKLLTFPRRVNVSKPEPNVNLWANRFENFIGWLPRGIVVTVLFTVVSIIAFGAILALKDLVLMYWPVAIQFFYPYP